MDLPTLSERSRTTCDLISRLGSQNPFNLCPIEMYSLFCGMLRVDLQQGVGWEIFEVG